MGCHPMLLDQGLHICAHVWLHKRCPAGMCPGATRGYLGTIYGSLVRPAPALARAPLFCVWLPAGGTWHAAVLAAAAACLYAIYCLSVRLKAVGGRQGCPCDAPALLGPFGPPSWLVGRSRPCLGGMALYACTHASDVLLPRTHRLTSPAGRGPVRPPTLPTVGGPPRPDCRAKAPLLIFFYKACIRAVGICGWRGRLGRPPMEVLRCGNCLPGGRFGCF